ncbi:MAG: hypothetical protein ACLFVL_06390 [Candidatus Aenigmatarchaeota archaeon]
MEAEEIINILDEELKDTGWKYKYWKRDDEFEFRNTGAELSNEESEEKIEKFLEDLEEDSFKPLLTGRLGIQKKNGKFIEKSIDRDGKPSGEGREISEERIKERLKESLTQIDCEILPTNIAIIDPNEVIDIYSENVRGLKLVTVNMKGEKLMTLRDDGGLQFETR